MLEIKKKNLDRREWYSDSDKKFSCRCVKDDFFEGGLGLVTFTGIKTPDMVDTIWGEVCIADKGYRWLELAPKDKNYVLTAMICEDEIFQIYVDISMENKIFENGDAEFLDLFLDIVIREDEVRILDSEELDEALDEGVITDTQYQLAKKTAEDLIIFFKENQKVITNKLYEYLKLF